MAKRAEPVGTVVIGAGQAGLAIGHHLTRLGLRLVILDGAARVGETWRSRWDTLRLFTPAQYDALPGMPFPAPPDTYPTKDQVAAYLETYAQTFDLPVRLQTHVTAVTRDNDRYLVHTASETLSAVQVVVATGPFQVPVIPPVASGLDANVTQLHSGAYRNPDQLPDGQVLVVGGGNSGCQIAEELAATRRVDLALGQRLPVLPQRLAGRDLFWWLTATGLMGVTAGSRMGRRLQERDAVIGTGPRHLRRRGVRMRPRLTATDGTTAVFADGTRLDNVTSVIWATGYRADHTWIEIPDARDSSGAVIQHDGVTPAPGLYTVGLAWQHTRGSGLLGFVKDDATRIAERIVRFERHRDVTRSAGDLSPSGVIRHSADGSSQYTALSSQIHE